VSLVLHVDPPADAKDYLHRSGRTARAGSSGLVVSIVTPKEERTVRGVLSGAGVQAEQRDTAPGESGMVDLTGARVPSGVALVEPMPAVRAGRGERTWQPRSNAGRPDGRFSPAARPRARRPAPGR
jgi:hypothetical protein